MVCQISLNLERVKYWIGAGATCSDPCHDVIAYAGLLPPRPMAEKAVVDVDDEEGALALMNEWHKLNPEPAGEDDSAEGEEPPEPIIPELQKETRRALWELTPEEADALFDRPAMPFQSNLSPYR